MNIDNSIFLRTNIPRARFCAIDNLNGTTFNESDILCCVPMTFKPFQNIVLGNDNQFTFYMSNRELTSFRLYITDENGNLLPFKIDYTLALKFEYLKPKEEDYVLNTLQEIRDLLQYTTLDKFL